MRRNQFIHSGLQPVNYIWLSFLKSYVQFTMIHLEFLHAIQPFSINNHISIPVVALT